MYKEHIENLQRISGMNAKKQYLEEHKTDDNLKSLLFNLLSPMRVYNISTSYAKFLLAPYKVYYPEYLSTHPFNSDINTVFDWLASKNSITNNELEKLRQYIQVTFSTKEEQDAVVGILTKSVRLGITATTVNKVFPGLITVWEVQQAYKIDDSIIPQGADFWLTQKLNGVRATYYKGKLYGRNGTPFVGLEHITSALESIDEGGLVFDGELLLQDSGTLSDNESFRVSTGIINSDNDKSSIGFNIFDVIPEYDFDSADPQINYDYRRQMLDNIDKALKANKVGCLTIVPIRYHGTDQSMIDKLLDQMVAEDKEGLMLNLNVPYKRKRHNGILKVKRFYTMDLTCVAVEEGTGKNSGKVGALVVDFDGNLVRVGSGLSDEQRDAFWACPDDIIGKLVEVKYKEITTNKVDNKKSLQFPVFLRIRNDKDNVSYE